MGDTRCLSAALMQGTRKEHPQAAAGSLQGPSYRTLPGECHVLVFNLCNRCDSE